LGRFLLWRLLQETNGTLGTGGESVRISGEILKEVEREVCDVLVYDAMQRQIRKDALAAMEAKR